MNILNERNAGVSSTATKISFQSPSQAEQVKNSKGSDQVSSASPKISQDDVKLSSSDDRFVLKQISNEKFNETAKIFREEGKKLADVEDQINKKHAEVQQYEKQYPPFQDQSSERVKFINSIKALKAQVDKLTLVKDYKDLTSIVNEPTSPKENVEQKSESGLNIASINSENSDAEIIQFGRDVVTTSQKDLESRQQSFKRDVELVSDQITSQSANDSDQQVTQNSEAVKQALATLHPESLGSVQGQNILESLV